MAGALGDRLFPLQGYGDEFFTGVCSDGRQVVMGLLCPHVVAYFFDSEGNLLEDEHRPWIKPAPRFENDGPYKIHDKDFQVFLAVQLLDWQAAIGFEPQTIHIRPFLDKRHPVGIEILPSHLRDVETTEWVEDEEERQELVADRDQWLADGNFVWYWAKDYWMDRDGDVEST